MRQPLILGTGTHYLAFNTRDSTGLPITLAGSPALRASINGGDYVNAWLTLSVDHDYNGVSAVTGLHRIALDIDNVTLALTDSDTVDVILSAGTVGGVSVVGAVLWSVVALDAGLTAAETADIETEITDRLLSASAKTALDLFAAILDPATGQLDEGSVAEPLKANVKEINDVTIDGAGTAGDPWGPA